MHALSHTILLVGADDRSAYLHTPARMFPMGSDRKLVYFVGSVAENINFVLLPIQSST